MSHPQVLRIRSAWAKYRLMATAHATKLWHSSLGRAAALTVILTMACKLIGFFKEQVVASSIGVAGALDAFHVAALLPTLGINVILQNLSASLVMTVVRERTIHGEDASRKMFAGAMFWGVLFSILFSMAVAWLGPVLLPVLSPGFTPELGRSASRMLWLLAPYSAISGLTVFWSSLLNSEGRFVASAVSPGLISIAVAGCLLSAGGLSGVDALVLGLTLGAVLDLLNLGRSMHAQGLPLGPRYAGWTQTHSEILFMSLPLVAGTALHFGTEVVDQSMASMLGEGSISELKYGNRIVGMVFGVLSIPISQVVFPHLVRLVNEHKWAELQTLARRSVLISFMISVPATVALVVFSQQIVSLTFERGKFSPESAMQVAAVQAMYAFQLPFYLWGILMVRLAVALRMNAAIFIGGCLNLSVNVAMNYVLMVPLGVTGIALSTALVYVGAACYFSAAIRVALRRKIQDQLEIDKASESEPQTSRLAA